MVERVRVRQLRGLVRLREAQAEAASEDLRLARDEHDAADRSRDAQRVVRDAAGSTWLRLLGEARPQPELVGMSADWLLEHERRLEAEDLNLDIARGRLEKSQVSYAEALAREAAARKSAAKARITMEKYLEERQSLRLADSLLWRWCR